MTRKEFEKLAAKAVRRLPEDFRSRIANVALIVKDRPDRDDLKLARVRKGSLYAIYVGTPLTERAFNDVAPLSDRIILYQKLLEKDFPDRDELVREIGKTVLHEVGHYFGLSEKELKKLGYE